MKLRLIGFVVVAVLFSALTAMAQIGKIEGTVKGKSADGKVIPIEGATIDIARQDQKGAWVLKTNKAGEFIHAGIPSQGTYTILVSAPGWGFTYIQDIKTERPPRNEFEMVPGDGRHVSYDELLAALKARASAIDAKSDEDSKKKADSARKANENFEAMKKVFEEGFEFYKKGNELSAQGKYAEAGAQFQLAVEKYKAATAMDSTEHVLFNNLSVALKNLGVSKYNTNNRDGAQQDFKDSIEASRKAISLYEPRTEDKDYQNTIINYHEFLAGTLAILGDRFMDLQALKDAVAEWTLLAGKYGSDNKKVSLAYSNIGDNLVNMTSAMGLEEGAAKRVEARTAFEKALSLDSRNSRGYLGQVKMIAGDPSADAAKYKEAVEFAKKAKGVAEPASAEYKQADAFIKDLEDTIAQMDETKKGPPKDTAPKKKKP